LQTQDFIVGIHNQGERRHVLVQREMNFCLIADNRKWVSDGK